MTDKEGNHAMNPQPPAAPVAPITPEKIAALRDALAKATPGEWFALTVEPTQLSGSHSACGTGYGLLQGPKMVQVHKADAFTPQDATAIALAHNIAPKLLAALDAAEAQAVEFAWYALHFFGGGVQNGVYDDSAHEKARSAAEYLAARGLLRKTGERTWQRVEGK